ncbi:ScbA/BarX family gamma-butyrolactone biosynthesis protein [Streptomyces sp. NPDC006879]|uniref:ScbA/BarX family gamma-butyrolactone biosynthesis protein n=1 Tax=Streptomyces sp. NPDC006879 TaxID=3364767 RepID=UPI0036D14A10
MNSPAEVRSIHTSGAQGSTCEEPGLNHTLRELTHRATDVDVIPTGWRRTGADRFLVSAHWSRNHPFFTPVAGGLHDPLLVAETLRQSGILVAHAAYDVPVGYHFLIESIDYAANPLMLGARGSGDVQVEVELSEIVLRGGALKKARTDVVIKRERRIVAVATAHWSVTAPRVYERLRAERIAAPLPDLVALPAPAPAALTGRRSAKDVVISPLPEDGRWLLRVDTSHPTLFQRRNDHVPGMLLLEAARQASASLTQPSPFVPTTMRSSFRRYVEFDEPCYVSARLVEQELPQLTSVEVIARQAGEEVFSAVLSSVRPC